MYVWGRAKRKTLRLRPLLTVEQILFELCDAEFTLSTGQAVAQSCRPFGISEHTYDRWRNEHGGLKVDQVKRLKDLERESTRLKCAIANLTLDTLILKEAAEEYL
jgi:transposase-like protein